MNVRFQPFRLEDSKCWRNSQGDARLACVSCHNPHEQLNQEASSYDAKCLTCHNGATGHEKSDSEKLVGDKSIANKLSADKSVTEKAAHETQAKICPPAKSNCITCHMPQVEVPSVHATFFDHRIRVVRPNAPYPM